MTATQRQVEDARHDRDILVLAKTVGANEFPVELPSVIGIDRETGEIVRVSPVPWKNGDTDPPLQRWAWTNVSTRPAARDPRAGALEPAGDIVATAYVDAKDGWRLRWPFVRPHVHNSIEAFMARARESGDSAGFVRPRELDVLQLPLRLVVVCEGAECATRHEVPVLDWELHEMGRAARERSGPEWATRFRESWGARLLERYDVHVLLSTYAQSPSRVFVAGLFYPPRAGEDTHEHQHHVSHREHLRRDSS